MQPGSSLVGPSTVLIESRSAASQPGRAWKRAKRKSSMGGPLADVDAATPGRMSAARLDADVLAQQPTAHAVLDVAEAARFQHAQNRLRRHAVRERVPVV